MRESTGSAFLYYMIIAFIIVVFGLITATLNYYKGYKVNSRILQAIQKNSGYNDGAKADINRVLAGIGYTVGTPSKCPSRDGVEAVNKGDLTSSYMYCIYYYPNENGATEKGKKTQDGKALYYSYGVTTYIYVDLPLAGQFKIPVYSKGERMRRFSNINGKKNGSNCQKGVDC